MVRGGLMGGLDDLYQQLILDHYRNRRMSGRNEGAAASIHEPNPAFRDARYPYILVEGGPIADTRSQRDRLALPDSATQKTSAGATGKVTRE